MTGPSPISNTFQGIGASQGVVVAQVYVLDRRHRRVPRQRIEAQHIERELLRLRRAISDSVLQLDAVRAELAFGGAEHPMILQAYQMMLQDAALFDGARVLIESEQINAEWAVSRVIDSMRTVLSRVGDIYLRERQSDFDFVAERLIQTLSGNREPAQRREVRGMVVVAPDLSPADTVHLTSQAVAGFVTEFGGKTSHTAIVARSLGVPAVVGVPRIYEEAGEGDSIVVDGFEGVVILRPDPSTLEYYARRAHYFDQRALELLEAKSLPAETLDQYQVNISGNIEFPNEIEAVLDRGGNGIGLYRTEFMFLGGGSDPDEETHYQTYRRIFDVVGDRQVTVRTMDLGADKILGRQFPKEANPALGLRAVRYCLRNPELFVAQIAGLLRAGVHGNLRIMIPMITGLEELMRVREIIDEVTTRLDRQGIEYRPNLPLGVMVEVPSAVHVADQLAAECDFFSIGTNDLIQYLLAVDRTNPFVDYLYQPLHPSLLHALRAITHAAARRRLPVSVCGEMAAETEAIPILLGLGIQELSVTASLIPQVKRLVRELSISDCRTLVAEVWDCRTAAETEATVRAFIKSRTVDVQFPSMRPR